MGEHFGSKPCLAKVQFILIDKARTKTVEHSQSAGFQVWRWTAETYDVIVQPREARAYTIFVQAQDRGGTYERALSELRAGRKTSHWMWFVFPQIAGLGQSEMSRRYAIESLQEAREYLAHPVLGPRLRECAGIVLATRGRTAVEIFGDIDARKLRSCMTLFHRAAPDEPLFREVLDRYFGGVLDPATDALLG